MSYTVMAILMFLVLLLSSAFAITLALPTSLAWPLSVVFSLHFTLSRHLDLPLYLALPLLPALVLLWSTYIWASRNRAVLLAPRTPDSLPFVGDSLAFAQRRQQLFDQLCRWQKHFGLKTYQLVVPFMPPFVIISDPANIEFVLSRPDLFVKGAFWNKNCHDIFGDALINADGDSWRIQRRAGARFLTKARVRHLVEHVLPQQYEDIVEVALDEADHVGTTVDMQSVFNLLATRAMSHLAFDTDIDSTSPYCQAFEYAQDLMGDRFQDPLWPVTHLPRTFRTRRALSTLKNDGQRLLAAALELARSSSSPATASSAPHDENLAHRLFTALNGDSAKTAQAMMAYLTAGKDTLYAAMTWTLFELLRHPGEMARLRDLLSHEVSASTAKEATDGRTINNRITDGSKASIYALAILRESLRLHPPVPFEAKECAENFILPDGTTLPAGSIIGWSIYAMCRASEIWGQESSEWKPERWIRGMSPPASADDIGNTSDAGVMPDDAPWHIHEPSPSRFPVFHGGPRACLGQCMAEAEAVWTICRVVSEWDCEAVGSLDGARCTPSGLTMPKDGGLRCRVRRRVVV